MCVATCNACCEIISSACGPPAVALYAVFEYWESHIGQLNRKREYLDFLGLLCQIIELNLLKKKDMKWTDSADGVNATYLGG